MPFRFVHILTLSVLSTLSLAQSSYAQDDDDEFGLDDDIEIGPTPTPAPAPTETDPAPPKAPDLPDEEGDTKLDDFYDDTDGLDLLDDEEKTPQGDDTTAIYQDAVRQLSVLGPDEEQAGWEDYLRQYPKSAYKARIENRMRELEAAIYDIRIDKPTDNELDNSDKPLRFAQSMLLENIDPRRRLSVGFEWGLPSYLNLLADYEHALSRNLSVHGGFRRRYTGGNVEAGVKWAPVKSTRTGTLVTLIGDLRFNTGPAFAAARPQLAIGKRVGPVDLQLQGGVDLEFRANSVPKIVGGTSISYRAADIVGIFLDSHITMKSVPEDAAFGGGLFQFNVVTLGMKFFPTNKSGKQTQEINMGASVPVAQSYWQYHFGSFGGSFNQEL